MIINFHFMQYVLLEHDLVSCKYFVTFYDGTNVNLTPFICTLRENFM